jgi:hypothetical protein
MAPFACEQPGNKEETLMGGQSATASGSVEDVAIPIAVPPAPAPAPAPAPGQEPAPETPAPATAESVPDKIARLMGAGTQREPDATRPPGRLEPQAVRERLGVEVTTDEGRTELAYDREEAAEVLGVTPRRVAQLAAQGQLDVMQQKPLMVSAQSVEERRVTRRRESDRLAVSLTADQVTAQVAEQVDRILQLVHDERAKLTSSESRLLAEVSEQRDHLKAEVVRLRAQLEEERKARTEGDASGGRRWRKA